MMTLRRLSVLSFLVLVLAPLLGLQPAVAQTANACAVALHQQMQSIAKAQIQLNDANIQLDAQRSIAISKCTTSGAENQQCLTDTKSRFIQMQTTLQNAATLLNAAAQRVQNDFNPGHCLWSAQEIAQMISTLGQATSQITQSIAQVITASKDHGSSAGRTAGRSPPASSTEGATPKPAPAPPSSAKSP